jgi:hypothetical protein
MGVYTLQPIWEKRLMSQTTSPDTFRNTLAQFLTPQVWKQAYQAYRSDEE